MSLGVNRIFHYFLRLVAMVGLLWYQLYVILLLSALHFHQEKILKSLFWNFTLFYIIQTFYIWKSLQNSSKRQDRILNLTALITCLVLISVMQVSDWFESRALSENVRPGTTTPCGERYGLWNFCLGYCTKRERFRILRWKVRWS